MSKLMSVLGIIMLAFGVAIALMLIVNVTGQLQIWGTTMDTAATLVAGGILSLGLGGVIQAIYDRMGAAVGRVAIAEEPAPAAIISKAEVVAEPMPAPAPVVVEPAKPLVVPPPANTARLRFPGFKKVEPAAVAATTGAAVVATAEAMTPSVQETIEALEKAKEELSQSVGNIATPKVESPTIPLPPPAVVEPSPVAAEPEIEEEADAEAEAAEGDLFVVEDRVIRGRPARILSDDTVEAETDEGWMRFENLEHLNEYLDSVQSEE